MSSDIIFHKASLAFDAGYYVDPSGNVFNKNGFRLKTQLNPNGYLYVTTYVNSKHMTFSVHSLVAFKKFGNYKPLEVRHLNGQSTDNRWGNIAIGTHSENILDRPFKDRSKSAGYAGKFGGAVSGAKVGKMSRKLDRTAVSNIKISKAPYRTLAKEYGVSKTVIYNIKNNLSYFDMNGE